MNKKIFGTVLGSCLILSVEFVEGMKTAAKDVPVDALSDQVLLQMRNAVGRNKEYFNKKINVQLTAEEMRKILDVIDAEKKKDPNSTNYAILQKYSKDGNFSETASTEDTRSVAQIVAQHASDLKKEYVKKEQESEKKRVSAAALRRAANKNPAQPAPDKSAEEQKKFDQELNVVYEKTLEIFKNTLELDDAESKKALETIKGGKDEKALALLKKLGALTVVPDVLSKITTDNALKVRALIALNDDNTKDITLKTLITADGRDFVNGVEERHVAAIEEIFGKDGKKTYDDIDLNAFVKGLGAAPARFDIAAAENAEAIKGVIDAKLVEENYDKNAGVIEEYCGADVKNETCKSKDEMKFTQGEINRIPEVLGNVDAKTNLFAGKDNVNDKVAIVKLLLSLEKTYASKIFDGTKGSYERGWTPDLALNLFAANYGIDAQGKVTPNENKGIDEDALFGDELGQILSSEGGTLTDKIKAYRLRDVTAKVGADIANVLTAQEVAQFKTVFEGDVKGLSTVLFAGETDDNKKLKIVRGLLALGKDHAQQLFKDGTYQNSMTKDLVFELINDQFKDEVGVESGFLEKRTEAQINDLDKFFENIETIKVDLSSGVVGAYKNLALKAGYDVIFSKDVLGKFGVEKKNISQESYKKAFDKLAASNLGENAFINAFKDKISSWTASGEDDEIEGLKTMSNNKDRLTRWFMLTCTVYEKILSGAGDFKDYLGDIVNLVNGETVSGVKLDTSKSFDEHVAGVKEALELVD